MNRDRVLAELADNQGEYISGQELAARLNISRVAVWKHIEALKEQGYDIRAVSGRGYQLEARGGLISPKDVQGSLGDVLIGSRVIYLPRVDSTNEALKRLRTEGNLKEGTVLAAGVQERGKGRMGRHWESPPGGLWFSVLLQPRIPLERVALLSLVFAVAAARALDTCLPSPAMIKWPNDVYTAGKKLVGILLEASGELDGPEYLIVGTGINTNITGEDFPPELRSVCTSLLDESQTMISHNELLAGILKSMDVYYHRFMQDGFTAILPEFKAKCLHLGQQVELMQGSSKVSGVNVDINERGHLLVDTGKEIVEITTGDVNLVG